VQLEDGLFRLGGVVELDGRLHYYPAAWRGYAPSNQYFVRAGSGGLLVDTGFTAHESELVSQLHELVRPGGPLSLLVLREADYAALGGAAAVCDAFRVPRFYSCFRIADHLIGYSLDVEPTPEEVDTSYPGPGIEWLACNPGDPVECDGDSPGVRRLEIVSAPLRKVGSVRWAYDPETGTLFTADCFCHAVARGPAGPFVIGPGDADGSTVETVREQLVANFHWLPIATPAGRDAIAGIFDQLDVRRVAPAFGCVLEGSEVVDRHLGLVLDALTSLLSAARS
jgi:hypothetical protein